MSTHWRLPRGVDELLPPRAWDLEILRRRVLDVFISWGFDYVEPPLIEYLDALLVGSGEDLDLQTLKVVDQVSGRQLGVRADMTSQALRIDAHSIPTEGVQRLCYAGAVVFANPKNSQSSRVPLKAGAEIFGAPSLVADAEVIALMLEVMNIAQINQPVLLLGHMGIYRSLVTHLMDKKILRQEDQQELFSCIQRKGESDILNLLGKSEQAQMMAALPNLMGDISALGEARKALLKAPLAVGKALDELATLANMITIDRSDVDLRIDVSELSGYGYHNGPVFAVYHPEHGQALAQGGRYDGVGGVFGRSRPATGFDLSLKQLMGTLSSIKPLYFAPYVAEQERSGLLAAVAQLRLEGYRVVCALNKGEIAPKNCAGVLENKLGEWQLITQS
jgi:ATP phosphoribosyltransferase regulatory subunit